MALLFWLAAVAVPFFLGKGAAELLYGGKKLAEKTWADAVLMGGLVCIGFAEISHLAGLFLGLSFSGCGKIFAVLTALGSLFGLLRETGRRRRERTDASARREREKRRLIRNSGAMAGRRQLLYFIFGILVILQLILILAGEAVYRAGDMTVETVNSFLASDAVYQTNPLTGAAYELGLPLRLKILSLPSFYGFLSSLFGLPAQTVVYHLVPAAVLLCCYLVYGALAAQLFADAPEKRGIFLILVALLIWLGTYRFGVDGFDGLFCGWRGVSIRGLVLLPLTVLGCLRRDKRIVALCVLAEAAIVWTFYGFGFCLLTAVLMTAARVARDRLSRREGAGGKEGAGWKNS